MIENEHQTRLDALHTSIRQACSTAGRGDASIKIVAVSKKVTTANILPLLAIGHRYFAENRVQEAKAKWSDSKVAYPDLRLHLIGPLQTNKVKDAVGLFDVIEVVDRENLAARLAIAMNQQSRWPDCLVQINTGNESQKAGIAAKEAPMFIQRCRRVHGLPIKGVMCLPPLDVDPAPHFALARKIADEAALEVVSMGMSGDYKTACQLGATQVRIGTAIFGARPVA